MAVKLVNQALVGMHAQAACEAIRLAESFGLVDASLSADQSANFANARNVQLLKELLLNSWGQSKVLELVVSDYEQIINGAKSAGSVADALASAKSAAPLRNMDKDFDCISRDLSKALNSSKF